MKAASVRKHLAPARREEILQRYQRTSLTQQDFAAQAGISVSTLQAWRRKAAASKAPADARFVAVPNLFASPPAPAAYRLAWPSGLSLEVRSGFAVAELAAWLQLLPAV